MAVYTDATVIPLGSRENTTQSIVMIPAKAETNKPGLLCLQDVDTGGVVGEHFVWFDNAGAMRYGATIPADEDGEGSVVATTVGTITLDTAFEAGKLIDGSTGTGIGAFSVGCSGTHMKVETYHNATNGYINCRAGDLYLSASGGDVIAVANVTVGATAGKGTITTGIVNSAAQDVELQRSGTAVVTVTASDVDFAQDLNFVASKGIVGASSVNITTSATGSVLNLKTGDSADYFTFSAASNVPKIDTAGGCNLILASDSGTINASGILAVTGALSSSALTCIGLTSTATVGSFAVAVGASAASLWVSKDYNRLALGDVVTDSYIMYSGSNLTFYDANSGIVTLNDLASGSLASPTVTGDLTIAEGKFSWNDDVDEVAGTWDMDNVANNAITMTCGAMTTGTAIEVNTDGTLSSGRAFESICASVTGFTGAHFAAVEGGSDVFVVKKYGAVTITGNAAETDAITLTAGDLTMSDGFLDIDSGVVSAGHNIATADDGTSAVSLLTITNSVATYDMPLLTVDFNATGAYNAMYMTHLGTGYSISTVGGAASSKGFNFTSLTGGVGSAFMADGTTNTWVGAANTGFIHAKSDGALGATTTSLIYSTYTGNAAGESQKGTCAYFVDAGTASGNSYAVGITSASNNGLYVSTTVGATKVPLTCVGPASQTAAMVNLGATGVGSWLGAANVGLLNICATGNLAATTASMIVVDYTGRPANSGLGSCLRLVDSGLVSTSGDAYAAYINSSNNAGLHVGTGATDKTSLYVYGTAGQTSAMIDVVGSSSTGWIGAAGIGMVNLAVDGAFSGSTTASALQITIGTGTPKAGALGYAFRIADTTTLSATGYAAYISAANNEALCIAAGKTKILDGVEIETASGLGTDALLIDQNDSGGNKDALVITTVGTGYNLLSTVESVNGGGHKFVAKANQTTALVTLDADSMVGGMDGAANVGLLNISASGTLADADTSMCRLDFNGTYASAGKGGCLYIDDDGTASGVNYSAYINSNAVNGMLIRTGAATMKGLQIDGPASQTVPMVKIGATGVGSWIGAANVGLVDICSTGSLANADTTLLRIANTGAAVQAIDGSCLKIEASGTVATATGYAVSISASGTRHEALTVTAGDVLFAESLGASDTTIAGTLTQTGAATFTAGAQSAGVGRTATTDGGGSGTIADGTAVVVVTAASASAYITLPTPTPGNVVWIVTDATGCELQSNSASTVYINNGAGATKSSSLTGSLLHRAVCVTATKWILTQWDATGTESAGAKAA